MAHTKGEWEVVTEKHVLTIVRNADPHTYIAEIIQGIPEEEQQANAQLLAAAPKLLKECKRLREILATTGAGDKIVRTLLQADKVITEAANQ